MTTSRAFIVPEVVQTSAMDCGPASLKALLEGFGVPVSYGRLREACQTDVDGTSIDTLEAIAVQLGLAAEQVIVPVDHVLLGESNSLPAIVVVRLPNGFLHFVVAWRRVGAYVQLMDPATGRHWVRADRFLSDLHVHATPVPAQAFEEWVNSDEFTVPFHRRLSAIGSAETGASLLARAMGWRDRAALDASARWVTSIVRSGALAPGREAAAVLSTVYEQARANPEAAIPHSLWTGTPAPSGDDGEQMVNLRGAVLVRVAGLRKADAEKAPRALSPELVRALEEPPPRPWRALRGLLGGDGFEGGAFRGALAVALVAAVVTSVLEAILLRGAMSLGQQFGVVQQRLAAIAALLAFLVVLLALEVPLASGTSRLGRRLETRLRIAFLSKIPRLGDRYFASRPISDMAERCHAGQRIRAVPEVATSALRSILQIAATVVGIAWLDPPSAPWAALAAACSVALPVAFLPALSERDMKMRTHQGGLARFYLDAMLGLSPIRTHGAERSVTREHEGLLVEWARASRAMVASYVTSDLAQSLVGTLVAVALLLRYVRRAGDPTGVILLVYWALALPALGQELGVLLRQIPGHRNTSLRLLEPLGALEDDDESTKTPPLGAGPVGLAFDGVRVVAGGHTILDGVCLRIARGEHVAIVGASGAGKSSLLGLLLGWHKATEGAVLIDDLPLTAGLRGALRPRTAWVDPAVQLWNRPLIDNLLYGAPPDGPSNLGHAIDASELASVLEKLPEGMQTALGEGGGLVSGGEGQRVRLARALLRPDAGLVLLDEPFRGLDRDRRHALMNRARAWWKNATLLCVTHDVSETAAFERVVVIEGGQVVEDGRPSELLAQPSRYRAMHEAEQAVLRDVWGDPTWRRMRLHDGDLEAGGP